MLAIRVVVPASVWGFGCARIERVVVSRLHGVLQPVEAMALVEEIAVCHNALFKNRCIVFVVHVNVAVLRFRLLACEVPRVS